MRRTSRCPLVAAPRFRRAAFTLVEVCIAAAVLAVAISGLVGSLLAGMTLERVNRESAIAQEAALRALERLQGVPFREIFANYDDWTGDDAGLLVPARGPNFPVRGLSPQDGDLDGACGEVWFPTVVVDLVPQLREDVIDPALGMPRDLDSDGVVDALDHAGNFRLLPVRVRVQWRGVSGDRVLDVDTVLCGR